MELDDGTKVKNETCVAWLFWSTTAQALAASTSVPARVLNGKSRLMTKASPFGIGITQQVCMDANVINLFLCKKAKKLE